MHEASFGADLTKGSETIVTGVINGYTVVLEGTVPGEDVIEVNKIRGQVELTVHDQRLLRLLLLEHECSRLDLRGKDV